MEKLTLKTFVEFLDDKETFRLAFLGDSITAVDWLHPNWRELVEYILRDLAYDNVKSWKTASWGFRCYNCGFDGSASEDIGRLMNDEVFSLYPDMVIYQIGDNDADYKVSLEQFRINIESNIDRLLTFVKKVVITSDIYNGKPALNEKYAPYIEIVREIVKTKNVLFVDMAKEFAKQDVSKFFTLKSPGNELFAIKKGEIDLVHPNQLGNAYFAKVILKQVFGFDFDIDKYFASIKKDIMLPEYK